MEPVGPVVVPIARARSVRSMTTPTDGDLRSLVERARDGDADAWEAIYLRLRPRLTRYAVRRLGDVTAAEDAVSEAMVRAISTLDRFRWRGAGFDAWMFGIVRNVALEHGRRRSRTVHDDGRGGRGETDPRTQPETVAIEAGDHELVRLALEQLSDLDREIIDLRIVAELSIDETAAVLQKRSGAVRMAQSRALRRLRERVEEVSR